MKVKYSFVGYSCEGSTPLPNKDFFFKFIMTKLEESGDVDMDIKGVGCFR